MKPEALLSVLRRRAAALLLVPLFLSLTSCLELESVSCPGGLICPAGTKCAANESVCISTPCGDGITQANEQCDDGNLRDGDSCSRECKREACGNGEVDRGLGEVCDDGNTVDGDGCSANCRSLEKCGNRIVDLSTGEFCDDGNTAAGDGCSADCHSDERCGNRVIDHAAGEACDDGNTADGDGCSADCRSGEGCGNGIRDTTEECDDGNGDNNDGCLTTCVLARCGDGFIDAQAPGIEECDDAGESRSCDLNCTFSGCGDSIVNGAAGEQCDTGGVDSAVCNSRTCTISRCGDSIHNEAAGEECDDGNASNEDSCLTTCKQNICGDGYVNQGGPVGHEVCDDGNTRDETSVDCPYGEPRCNQFCNRTCSANLKLTGPFCGDGIHQPWLGEACEDNNIDPCGTCDETCKRYQFTNSTGSIVAVASSGIRDGEVFSISDGINLPKTFEFDTSDNGVRSDRIRVRITRSMDAMAVADAIADEINDTSRLSIRAETASGFRVVTLRNVASPRAGILGNQRIIETVDDEGFMVEGMSGGGANDCPTGTRCLFGEDCASHACVGGICVP